MNNIRNVICKCRYIWLVLWWVSLIVLHFPSIIITLHNKFCNYDFCCVWSAEKLKCSKFVAIEKGKLEFWNGLVTKYHLANTILCLCVLFCSSFYKNGFVFVFVSIKMIIMHSTTRSFRSLNLKSLKLLQKKFRMFPGRFCT